MTQKRSAPELIVRVARIVVFLLAASSFAMAATQNATCSSIAQSTDLANATITCSRFNPSSGELTGVTIAIAGAINGTITLTNTNPNQAEPAAGTALRLRHVFDQFQYYDYRE